MEKKPISTEVISRVTGAFRSLFSESSSSWMSPGQPVTPSTSPEQQEALAGRQFDFPVGINLRMLPRAGERVPFTEMRALAENCDILRIVIETRKDQMQQFTFSVKPKDENKDPDDRCKEVENFFAIPDGENNWGDWLRMLLEEMFVTDAATIYPWLTNDSKPYRFEVMDGTTIKRVIDARGRTPSPPDPAYQQILKGVNAVDYTIDELIYRPRNKRVSKIYGYSHVEQIIMTVNLAIRRAVHQLQYYTEGSTPDLLFQVPADWNMAAIKEFNEWWNLTLAGNTAERRKAQFVPNGVTPLNTKESVLKDSFDEWLARIVCYTFSVSVQPFIKEQNRATAETAHQMAMEEGLIPLQNWVKSIMDYIIAKYFGYTDLEFSWNDDKSVDPEVQARIDDVNLKNGTVSINEVRATRGLNNVKGGDLPMVLTATGYVPIDNYDAAQQALLDAVDNDVTPEANGEDPEEDDTEPVVNDEAGEAGEEDEDAEKVNKRLSISKAVKKKVLPINKNTPYYTVLRHQLSIKLFKTLTTLKANLIKEVVAAYNNLEKGVKRDASKILDEISWEGWGELQDIFGEHLILAAKLGVKDAYAQLDLNDPEMFELANESAVAWAEKRAAELVGKKVLRNGDIIDNPNAEYAITDATRAMIQTDVINALEEGLSNDELAANLEENYAFSSTRAETIARTETAFADSNGNLVLYRESGLVDSKQWVTGEGCCDECEEVDGEIVGIEENFSNGVQVPPLHPNCRCDVVPILNDDNAD